MIPSSGAGEAAAVCVMPRCRGACGAAVSRRRDRDDLPGRYGVMVDTNMSVGFEGVSKFAIGKAVIKELPAAANPT